MSSSSNEHGVTATYLDPVAADRAAAAARKAGFQVERPAPDIVSVYSRGRPHQTDEIQALLRAYGPSSFGSSDAPAPDEPTRPHETVRAEHGATLQLLEEELRPSKRQVQTGEVTIRREVITETRTIEVPVQREQLVIERRPIERRPLDASDVSAADPLIQQLRDRLRHLKDGESLRIPVVEEEVIITKQPVVIEEVSLRKRAHVETQTFSDTVRREEARIEQTGSQERGTTR